MNKLNIYRLNKKKIEGGIEQKNLEDELLRKKAFYVSKRYREIVTNFINRMLEVKPEFDFKNLKENIENLKIWTVPILPDKNEDSYLYIVNLNKILIKKEACSSLYEALMHMASTKNSRYPSVVSGFKRRLITNSFMGENLNIGYTKLLTERYFGTTNFETAFNMEHYFVENLEHIVGKEKMENLYFDADFSGLKEEVCKYIPTKDFFSFLRNFDWVVDNKKNMAQWLHGKVNDFSMNEMLDTVQSIGTFLHLTYIKKQYRLFSIHEISFDDFYKNVNECLNRVNNEKIHVGVVTQACCNKRELVECLENMGIKAEFFEASIYENGDEEKVNWSLIKR